MHRQKAVSRVYVSSILFASMTCVCVLTSILTNWHTRNLEMYASRITLPLESDVAICLARFADHFDSVETDIDDWEELSVDKGRADDEVVRLKSIRARRVSCRRSAVLFNELSSANTQHHKARMLVDKARASTGCHGKHPLDDCGSNRPKPLLLSRRSTTNVHESLLAVPNVVHFIRFGNMSFDFQQYVTFLSVHKFQKPDAIFIHGDSLPDSSLVLFE